MSDSTILTLFDEIYESTYAKTMVYITRRCRNAEDIADILQETYAEIYCVLIRKGPHYMVRSEAFVLRVARTKLHRHYAAQGKTGSLLPLSTHNEEGEEFDIPDLSSPGPSVEDRLVDHLFLDEVVKLIQDKPIGIQRAIYLHYGLDLPIPQVAAELGVKEATAKSWIYRTVRDVRRYMEAEGGPR